MRLFCERAAWVRVAAVLVGTWVVCFVPVLFQDRQFGFRDASHHYYPLYHRVQQEWAAGRVPLWDAWENGGMPLLGNPTASVFYPGQLLFHVLPFGWGMRLYVSLHVLVACVGMYRLLRGQGRSETASLLGSLAFGFGGPVLLLYNNVIYLVGASWIGWGLASVAAWLRTGRPRDLAGFALFLSLQVLGGEPHAAYLTFLAALGLALVPRTGAAESGQRGTGVLVAGIVLVIVAAWVGARFTPGLRNALTAIPGQPALERVSQAVVLICSAAALGTALVRRKPWGRTVLALLGAGLLAGTIAAAQVLPVAENLLGSTRTGPRMDRYGFSLVPYRLVEMVVPGVLGQPYQRNHSWRSVLPPANDPTFWVASVYIGGATLGLAFVGLCARPSRARRWLMACALLAGVASLGLYASPAGLGRWLPGLGRAAGPVDAGAARSLSEADLLAGDGSVYFWLNLLVPGLDLFRYPSKLFTWVALCLSILAANGWDLAPATSTVRRWALRLVPAALAGCLLIGLAFAWARHGAIVAWAAEVGRPSQQSGPFDAERAWQALVFGLVQALVVLMGCAGALWLRPAGPRLAGWLIVLLTSLDLLVAHRSLIWTVPQSVYDAEPEVVSRLGHPEPGQPPIRIHRPSVWYPFGWFAGGSDRRIEELARWERTTLQPLHGLPENVGYALTLGIMESPRYLALFRPWLLPAGPTLGPMVGLAPSTQVLYFPRRAFDLWGTEYFLLPLDAGSWRDDSRALASFLESSQVLEPPAQVLADADERETWRRDRDWQLVRNNRAYPRAWVVHQIQVIGRLDSYDEAARQARIRALLFANDALWNEPDRPVLNPRELALVESNEAIHDRPRVEPVLPDASETAVFTRFEPNRVELEVSLGSRGLLVLAESEAPGWKAEIDGAPERIWRVNLGMRGVSVPAGKHRVVFRYEPLGFRVGAALSLTGLLVLGLIWLKGGRSATREPRNSGPTSETPAG